MNYNKQIITLTTSILATAGIIATATTKRIANSRVKNAIGQCILYTCNCTNNALITCKTAFSSAARTVYTFHSTNCVNKVHYLTQDCYQ